MKQPLRSGDAFLDDVCKARLESPEQLHVWWLGQSGFLCCTGDKAVLFDPYLSDSLTRKYAGTDKAHTRMTGLVIEPGRLDFIDVVTSTHNHTDHLDAETLNPLREANADLNLLIPEANRGFVAERLECDPGWPVGLDIDVKSEVAGVTFTGIPAAHDTIERDEKGRSRFLGYVAQWNGFSVYHSGDTRPIDGLADRLKPFALDVALLPVNGALEERRVSGNLWGQEAAALAHNAGARQVVPCHYDMFTFNTETPRAFEEACQRRQQPFTVLQNGERLSLPADS
ncbi:MAG: MBL fold metallo-hydrolase [Opitutales bacterium]